MVAVAMVAEAMGGGGEGGGDGGGGDGGGGESVTCTLLVRHIHTETTKLVKTTFVHSFSKHRVSELSD